MRILISIALGLSLSSFATVTRAQLHRCPDAFAERPRCLDLLQNFREPDGWQARECRRDIESFVARMAELQNCYQRMEREASEDATRRANAAVREFNCIMRGGVLCREPF